MPDTLRNATLRQLQIFLMAAERGSFAQAAAQLHLTKPAVSMQMAQLAEAAGQPLFEKVGRNLRLSRAGQALLPYAQRIAQAVREGGEELDALKGLRHGRVRIALVATTQYFMPRLLALFRGEHPGIQLEVSIGSREQVIRHLQNRDVELAIMGRPPQHMPVTAEPFAQHPHGIIAAPQHRLTVKRRVDPRELAVETFMAREPGSGTRHAMDEYFSQHAIEPAAVQEMNSNESIKQAVMAGMGLAFISLHTVSLEHQTGHLVLLNAAGLPVSRNWFVIKLAGHPLSPSAMALEKFIRDEAPTFMQTLLPGVKAAGGARVIKKRHKPAQGK